MRMTTRRGWWCLVVLLCHICGPVAAQYDCPKEEGLFPDPEQCDKYWECRNGESTRRICPDGLAFHPGKQKGEDPCDMIHNVPDKCKKRTKLQRPKPGDAHCPRQNGVYPSEDPSECDIFYSCLNGVGSATKCAEGLHYSQEVGTCVWARDSGRKGCGVKADDQPKRKKKKPTPSPSQPKQDKEEPKTLSNGFRCPGGKLGVHPALPHPSSCRHYYICLNGVTATEAGCSAGLVFNPDTSSCDKPANVRGCEDTYSTKPKKKAQVARPPAREIDQL